MDYMQQLIRRARLKLWAVVLVENLVLLGAWLVGDRLLRLDSLSLLAVLVLLATGMAALAAGLLGGWLLRPLQAVWQAINHLAPEAEPVPAPDLRQLGFGRELVVALISQVQQVLSTISRTAVADERTAHDLSQNFVAQNLPLPLWVLDDDETIRFANQAAADYVGLKAEDMIGKNVYMVLDMSFPSEATFDSWLKVAKTEHATASGSWERVRLAVRDGHPDRHFDLAAYYNRGNPDQHETMLVMFDHTKQYSQDDQAVSFIALSVHELRTPLTLLRGYIEVFEEEVDVSDNPELASFMNKMHSQAEQLMAYVNNILNVARVDNDQLELHLEEATWPDVLRRALDSLELRARVRGIELKRQVADDLPTVGVDPISISEVINNLIDNAIKYSGQSKVIEVDAHLTPDGLVETTVRDYGVGIPSGVMPNLFTKFYRDHRNRAQIGGTGLGLYLSKAIVDAHGGNLWVRSKEGQGSTFGFTLLPYERVAEDAKQTGNRELVRNAHGWVKNHSLYRR